jgi:hypothetical protein
MGELVVCFFFYACHRAVKCDWRCGVRVWNRERVPGGLVPGFKLGGVGLVPRGRSEIRGEVLSARPPAVYL